MGLVLTPALLLAGPATASADFEGPDPAAMSSPEMVAANAAAIAVAAVQQAELQSPEAVAARAESADAFAELSGSEASDLATETFAPLSDPTWQPPEVPDGWELVRYEGKTGMLIAPEGTADLLAHPPETIPLGTDLSNLATDGRVIESTMPIRAQDGSEGLQPVDPTLDDRGDYVEPANAPVEAEIPDDLADGIELPELDVSLRPEGAIAASDAELIGPDKLFYSGVATDTDFLATPTPIGVETFLQLRSAASPEQQSLHVDLPAGGSLSSTDDGGAVIEDDEGPAAAVLPPTATDADGTPVPVEMSVDGSSLVVEVDHQGGDYHYPILVDPVVQSYDWLSWAGDGCPGAGTTGNVGWWFETTAPTKFGAAPCLAGNYGMGLMNSGAANKTFAANDYSQWIWKPPAKTSIQSVTFGNAWHSPATTCSTLGVYDPQSASWQASNLADPDRCAYWFGNKTYAPGSTGVEQNLAVIGLSYPTAGKRTSGAKVVAGTFAATIYDEHPPELTSDPPDDSAWVDDTEGTSTHEYSADIEADDEGLGIKYFWFLTPQLGDPSQWAVQTYVRPCSGMGAGSCYEPTSDSKSFSYRLPEGESTGVAIAFDQAATMNVHSYQWTQRIDRDPPSIDDLGGNLLSQSNNIINTRSYEINIAAHDGDPALPSTMRSGVQQVSASLDGFPDVSDSVKGSCDPATNECEAAMTANLALDFAGVVPGVHEVTINVIDGVGHTDSRTVSVTVRGDVTNPNVDLQVTPPNETGAFTVTISGDDGSSATGPGDYGSGIGHVEVYDGISQIAAQEQECPEGGCSISETIAGQTTEKDPEITAAVSDRAGNVTIVDEGPPKRKFQWFGYNEAYRYDPGLDYSQWDPAKATPHDPSYTNFPAQTITTAREGGANVLRELFDWCAIVGDFGPNSDPDQWNWGSWQSPRSVEGFFWSVRYVNLTHQGAPVTVLPTFEGSPPWARPYQELANGSLPDTSIGCHDANSPPGQHDSPPDEQHMVDWSRFIKVFLQRYGPVANPQYPLTSGPANGINAVEVWNEPNNSSFWGMYKSDQSTDFDPARVARLVKATYDGVTQAGDQSSVDVLASGLAPRYGKSRNAASFSHAILSSLSDAHPSDAQAAEGMSLHLYDNQAVGPVPALDTMNAEYRDVVNAWQDPEFDGAYAGATKWITELGFPSKNVPNFSGSVWMPLSDRTQQIGLRMAVMRFASKPNPPVGFIVHQLWDDFPKLNQGEAEDNDQKAEFGVWQDYTADGPKPVYCILERKVAIPGVDGYSGC